MARCAPDVHPVTINALIETESGRNPYAVANVSDNESRQFKSLEEAIRYVNNLDRQGKNYSAGLMQINSNNFKSYGLDNNKVFDVCKNIQVGAKILTENFERQQGGSEQKKVRNALSRFYSGNDKRGYIKEFNHDGKSYVERVEQKAYKVPALLPPDNNSLDLSISKDIATVKTETNFIQRTSSWDVFGDFK
ncbi:lytic transglycosylase domain-containing protein [Erwinia tasmaniensis]|uniref:lytic transglycosylase domain-containing protein n=1 Tax=Erwinia tasmaniensis TaxID=338565 RepID=UPI000A024259|nr:lytic transglycosylase domain-containing protein [Erwinia tasmaniensis]